MVAILLTIVPCHASVEDCIDLSNKAIILQQGGKYLEAESLLKQVLSLASKAHRDDIQAQCLVEIGRGLDVQQKYAESAACYDRCITLCQQLTNAEDVKDRLISEAMVGKANVFLHTGDYLNAEKHLKESLKLVENDKSLSAITLTGSTILTLANLYSVQQKFALAATTAKRALALLPSMGASKDAIEFKCKVLQLLSNSYAYSDNYVEAEKTALEAVRLCEANTAMLQLDMACSCRTIGVAYMQKGDFVGARTWIEKARAADEKLLGPNSSDLAIDFDTLGVISAQEHKAAQAKSEFQRALAILARDPSGDPILVEQVKGHLKQVAK